MLIHNRGHELPVFPWWTRVAWTSEQMRRRADSGAETFVRRVTLDTRRYAGATSLKRALQMGDDALNRVADYTGIGVVEHTWGLCRRQPSRDILRSNGYRLLGNDLVPEDFHLVAEVVNIAPLVEATEDTWWPVCEKINAYYDDIDVPGPKLANVHAHQVGFHEVNGSSGPTLQADLMDIDLYFM